MACYLTMLSFYSKVLAFLLQESQIKRILQSFETRIPNLVTTFNDQANQLSKLMQVETLAAVEETLDITIDNFGMSPKYSGTLSRASREKLPMRWWSSFNRVLTEIVV